MFRLYAANDEAKMSVMEDRNKRCREVESEGTTRAETKQNVPTDHSLIQHCHS